MPEFEENSEPALEYFLTEKDKQRLALINQILTQAKSLGIKLSIFGGYGLDGLYGQQTRAHDDLDMFIDDETYEAAKKLIVELGGDFISEDNIKVVFTFPQLDNFKVEFAKAGVLKNYTDQEPNDFMPEEENVSLSGFNFRAPNLSGQKIIIAVETQMAKQNNWIYPEPKETNRDLLIEFLKKQATK